MIPQPREQVCMEYITFQPGGNAFQDDGGSQNNGFGMGAYMR